MKEKLVKLQFGTYPQVVVGFLGGRSVNIGEAIFVHNPIGFHTFGGFSGVKNQSFLDP